MALLKKRLDIQLTIIDLIMAQKFEFQELELKGVFLIKPFFVSDNRGGFIKDYNIDTFKANGIDYELKEVFYTISKKGVMRAIHFQKIKQQPKLVRCISGKIFDVVVDLRKNSPTFMQWKGLFLSGENMIELLIPSGFGHGYLVVEESIVSYKCAESFYQEFDSGIKYDDPDLNIVWPYELIGGKDKVINSIKDDNLQSFKQFLDGYNNNF